MRKPDKAVLLITHYQAAAQLCAARFRTCAGRMGASCKTRADAELAQQLEDQGYEAVAA